MRRAIWVAAMLMAMSMSGSVLAEDVSTTIVLQDGDGCEASLTGGQLDLGTWLWDGNGYKLAADSPDPEGEVELSVSSNAYEASGTCSVTITSGPLEQEDGDGIINDALKFTRNTTGSEIVVEMSLIAAPTTIEVSLADDIETKLASAPPGTYYGTIVVSTGSAPSGSS